MDAYINEYMELYMNEYMELYTNEYMESYINEYIPVAAAQFLSLHPSICQLFELSWQHN